MPVLVIPIQVLPTATPYPPGYQPDTLMREVQDVLCNLPIATEYAVVSTSTD